MRLRNQFILSIVFFGLALLVVSASVFVVNQQLSNWEKQGISAKNIQTGASELSYFANRYFLYGQETTLTEWKTKFTLIYNEISELNSTNPQQQIFVNNIKTDFENMAIGFSNVVTFLQNEPQNESTRAIPEFQAAWNQTAQQYNALNVDSFRLTKFIDDQISQLSLTLTALILVVFGLFGSYFVSNYLITYRRTLKAILGLKKGTDIIGSGNLEYQIKTDQKDEIGELAYSFNQMTTHLKTVMASKTELAKEIAERKKAEGALRDNEQRWATTLTSIGDGVIATDVTGQITFMNGAAENLTGWSLRETSKKPFSEIFKIINDQTRLECEDPVIKVLRSELAVGLDNHTVLVKRSGFEIPIDDSAAPIRGQDGHITGVVIVFRDRTERRNAEEKLKESNARIEMMNEKLRVMSSLTRHDVRNKLSTVTGYAFLLKMKHADQADIVDKLGKMEQAVGEVVKIFDFAKMYEQIGVEELTYVDVAKAVDEAVALLPDLTVQVVNDCQGLAVLADTFLRQLFYNFVDNTIKYGKKTTIIKMYFETTEFGGLQVVYEDDGVGISVVNRGRLFTEGFSTGGSTGFGLFLIKKMVDIYGWTIQEVGEPCKGAKFIITIPKLNNNGKENYHITQ